jgi:hypothetical protein
MRVIVIQSTDATVSATHGTESPPDGAVVRKLDIPLARRDLLKGSGVLIGVLASGSLLASLAPSTVWALELKQLGKEQGEALMAMGRTLYPHKKLPDAVYALLVKDLDAKAGESPETAALLRTGVSDLDKAAGGSFAKATPAKRLAAVKGMEGGPFFNAVRGQCVTSLYDNDMAFAALGYEGPAWDKGGYITRGFQDLKWLPSPPASASPPPYMG